MQDQRFERTVVAIAHALFMNRLHVLRLTEVVRLGIKPDLLVVPPSLEDAAEEILLANRNAAGATNTQKGKAKILVAPWLEAA